MVEPVNGAGVARSHGEREESANDGGGAHRRERDAGDDQSIWDPGAEPQRRVSFGQRLKRTPNMESFGPASGALPRERSTAESNGHQTQSDRIGSTAETTVPLADLSGRWVSDAARDGAANEETSARAVQHEPSATQRATNGEPLRNIPPDRGNLESAAIDPEAGGGNVPLAAVGAAAADSSGPRPSAAPFEAQPTLKQRLEARAASSSHEKPAAPAAVGAAAADSSGRRTAIDTVCGPRPSAAPFEAQPTLKQRLEARAASSSHEKPAAPPGRLEIGGSAPRVQPGGAQASNTGQRNGAKTASPAAGAAADSTVAGHTSTTPAAEGLVQPRAVRPPAQDVQLPGSLEKRAPTADNQGGAGARPLRAVARRYVERDGIRIRPVPVEVVQLDSRGRLAGTGSLVELDSRGRLAGTASLVELDSRGRLAGTGSLVEPRQAKVDQPPSEASLGEVAAADGARNPKVTWGRASDHGLQRAVRNPSSQTPEMASMRDHVPRGIASHAERQPHPVAASGSSAQALGQFQRQPHPVAASGSSAQALGQFLGPAQAQQQALPSAQRGPGLDNQELPWSQNTYPRPNRDQLIGPGYHQGSNGWAELVRGRDELAKGWAKLRRDRQQLNLERQAEQAQEANEWANILMRPGGKWYGVVEMPDGDLRPVPGVFDTKAMAATAVDMMNVRVHGRGYAGHVNFPQHLAFLCDVIDIAFPRAAAERRCDDAAAGGVGARPVPEGQPGGAGPGAAAGASGERRACGVRRRQEGEELDAAGAGDLLGAPQRAKKRPREGGAAGGAAAEDAGESGGAGSGAQLGAPAPADDRPASEAHAGREGPGGAGASGPPAPPCQGRGRRERARTNGSKGETGEAASVHTHAARPGPAQGRHEPLAPEYAAAPPPGPPLDPLRGAADLGAQAAGALLLPQGASPAPVDGAAAARRGVETGAPTAGAADAAARGTGDGGFGMLEQWLQGMPGGEAAAEGLGSRGDMAGNCGSGAARDAGGRGRGSAGPLEAARAEMAALTGAEEQWTVRELPTSALLVVLRSLFDKATRAVRALQAALPETPAAGWEDLRAAAAKALSQADEMKKAANQVEELFRQVARDTDKFQEFSHAKKRATDAADDLRTRLGSLLALLPPAS